MGDEEKVKINISPDVIIAIGALVKTFVEQFLFWANGKTMDEVHTKIASAEQETKDLIERDKNTQGGWISLKVIFLLLFFFPVIALAQTIPPDAGTEISFGKYSLPVIVWLVTSILYYALPSIPNRLKVLIAVCIGVALGLLFIPYSNLEFSIKTIVDHILFGLMAGFTSSGIYEGINRAVARPRE